MNWGPGKILVVSPHADDEVLGCTSILAENVHVLYLGVDQFHVVTHSDRLLEIEAVANLLGFSWNVGPFTVNQYHLDIAEMIRFLESAVADMRPSRIFSPVPSYNQDHRTVWRAVQAATRRHDRNHAVSEVYLYEEPDNFLDPVYRFRPQVFVPLNLERKLAANRLHASQRRGHRSDRILSTMAATRGEQSGVPYAEAFEVVRVVIESQPLPLEH